MFSLYLICKGFETEAKERNRIQHQKFNFFENKIEHKRGTAIADWQRTGQGRAS